MDLMLGIFVSTTSFYGMGYVLKDEQEDECGSYTECINKNFISKKNGGKIQKLFNDLNVLWWFISIIIFLLFLIIIIFILNQFKIYIYDIKYYILLN